MSPASGTSSSITSPTQSSTGGLSAGASAGIGIGVAIGVLLLGGFLAWFILRRRLASARMSWERQRQVIGSPENNQWANKNVALRYDRGDGDSPDGGRITTVENSQNLESETIEGRNAYPKE